MVLVGFLNLGIKALLPRGSMGRTEYLPFSTKCGTCDVGKYTSPICFYGLRFDNYISIYVMFAVGALECIGLRLGKFSSGIFRELKGDGDSFVAPKNGPKNNLCCCVFFFRI